jgi:hypothetical protein
VTDAAQAIRNEIRARQHANHLLTWYVVAGTFVVGYALGVFFGRSRVTATPFLRLVAPNDLKTYGR